MNHNHSLATRRLAGLLSRHNKSPHLGAVVAALFIALGLMTFSLATASGEGRLDPFGMKVAFADEGQSKALHSEPQTPTPSITPQPGLMETQQGDMDMGDDHGSTGSEDKMDMDDGHATSGADDHGTAGSEDKMDMGDGHESAGTDDHETAGSDDHGSAEYDASFDLVRNITLGGLAGINGSVLVVAGILKKRNSKKDRGRITANRTAITPSNSTTSTTSTTSRAISSASVVSMVSVGQEAAPIANTIITADTEAPKGDDLA